MPAPYSRDLRERLLRAVDAGLPAAEIARATGVSPRSLARWRARARRGESLAPRPSPGRRRRLTPAQEDALAALVRRTPDATLAEHREQLARDHGLTVSRATLCRILQRHRLTLKKRA